MGLGKTIDRNALLEELRGEQDCADPAYKIMRACEVAGHPLEVREVDGRPEVFSSGMPEDLKREVKVHRDPLIRAIWMRDALVFLGRRGLDFPFDVVEDINRSYDEDDLEGFRECVRGWIRELVRRTA